MRRGLALGGALVVVILIVLGVKGCLDARAHRALSDYSRNVTQIVQATNQTSKAFFGKLEDPGNLSVTRVRHPGQGRQQRNGRARLAGRRAEHAGGHEHPQRRLELVYELRATRWTRSPTG